MPENCKDVVFSCFLCISLVAGCGSQCGEPFEKVATWMQGTGEDAALPELVLQLRKTVPSTDNWEELLVTSESSELRTERIMRLSSAVFLDRYGDIDEGLFQAMCKMCLSDRMRFRSMFRVVVPNRHLEKDELDEIAASGDRYLARFVTWLNNLEAPPQGKSMFGVLVLSSALGREEYIKIAAKEGVSVAWMAIQDEVAQNGDYYVFDMQDRKFQIDSHRSRLKISVDILEQEPFDGGVVE